MWWHVSGMSIIIHSSLQKGISSLMWACENGHAKVVRILVLAGAHVNDQDKVSSTAQSNDPCLYPDVKLYSEVESSYNYDWGRRGWEREMGGGSGRTYGKGWRGRRWQGDEEMGTGQGVKE